MALLRLFPPDVLSRPILIGLSLGCSIHKPPSLAHSYLKGGIVQTHPDWPTVAPTCNRLPRDSTRRASLGPLYAFLAQPSHPSPSPYYLVVFPFSCSSLRLLCPASIHKPCCFCRQP